MPVRVSGLLCLKTPCIPPCDRLKDPFSPAMISRLRRRGGGGGIANDDHQLGGWRLTDRAEVAGSSRFGLRFRHMGGDRIHQNRRETIIRLKPEFLET